MFRQEYCSDCYSESEEEGEEEDNDNNWVDEYDKDNENHIPDYRNRYKISDHVNADRVLSDESINCLMLLDKCVSGRNCSACPNERDCAGALGTVKICRENIRTLRERYWNISVAKGVIIERRKRLLDDLTSFKVVNSKTGTIDLQYKIGGVFVCKKFFFVSVQ